MRHISEIYNHFSNLLHWLSQFLRTSDNKHDFVGLSPYAPIIASASPFRFFRNIYCSFLPFAGKFYYTFLNTRRTFFPDLLLPTSLGLIRTVMFVCLVGR